MKSLAVSAVALLLLAASPVFGYNRDTHQHLTELAWAYIKAVNVCSPVLLQPPATMDACAAGCRDTLGPRLRELGGGYSCACAEEHCEDRCENLSGYAKYLCVDECVRRGPGFVCLRQGSGTTVGIGCTAPYYWSQVEGETIIEDTCGRTCCEERALLADDRCRSFCGVIGSGALPVERAQEAVRFYQTFEATACPPREGPGYQYHSNQDLCQGPLVTEKKRLVDWREAPLPYKPDPVLAKDHLPVVGGLLATTNSVSLDDYTSDLTGTIIGFHSSTADTLSDLHTGVRVFPAGEDFLKTAVEINAGIAGGGIAAAIAAGGLYLCAISCPVTVFFGECDDCFEKTFSIAKAVIEKTRDVINAIEEQDLVPINPGPTTLGKDNTSMFHFMTEPPSRYDDLDGYRPNESFGPGGAVIGGLHEGLLFDQLADIRVLFKPSRRALLNYQPQETDDRMAASSDRGVFYWHRQGMMNYTFPPVDNLTYYWWHKWLEGRVEKKTASYGLLPLGAVLHGVQDITQPFHTWGISLQGHEPYEDRISQRLDAASADEDVSDPGDLFLRLDNPEEDRLFLERIGQYLLEIRSEVLRPEEGVLHPRRLMHFLRDKVVDAPTEVKLSDDKPGLSWWDYDVEDSFIRKTGIPLAVAATVAVLVEGSRNLQPYQDRLDLDLDHFERAGDVPPVTEAAPIAAAPTVTVDLPAGFDKAYPEWICAGERPRSQTAIKNYFADTVTGSDLTAILFAEKTRCELSASGLPVPDDATLDRLGRYEARMMQTTLRWYSHGSVRRLQQELACNDASPEAEGLLTPEEKARAAALCAGTLDSDGDGVPDPADQCWTPRSLSSAVFPVRPDGCAFVHEAFPGAVHNPFLPGAVRREP